MSSGSKEMSDSHKNDFTSFSLSEAPDNSAAALLIIAAKNVNEERSFITVNSGNIDDDTSFDEAADQPYFVTRFTSTGSTFTTQVHRIAPGRLQNGSNHLGIHARAADGTTSGNIDDFEVARIFLVYTTTA